MCYLVLCLAERMGDKFPGFHKRKDRIIRYRVFIEELNIFEHLAYLLLTALN